MGLVSEREIAAGAGRGSTKGSSSAEEGLGPPLSAVGAGAGWDRGWLSMRRSLRSRSRAAREWNGRDPGVLGSWGWVTDGLGL